MDMEIDSMAPSPEQPLNGQGVLRIPRTDSTNVDDNGKCPPTTVLTTPHPNDYEGSGVVEVTTDSGSSVNDIGMDKDTGMEKAGSSDSTLEPNNPKLPYKAPSRSLPINNPHPETGFFTRKRNRKRQFKPDPTLIHFDSLFGSGTWSRYLVLTTSKAISAAKLELLLLSISPSKDMNFRLINHNEWLIEATTKEQSEIYQSISNLNGIDVSVTKHDNLNSIFGTVILPENNDGDGLPEEHILLDSLRLRYPNIQKVEVYNIPNRKQPHKQWRIAKIKFEGQVLPKDIKIEGQRRELRPFIPKPLQCKLCSKYGHSYKVCRNPRICAYCGSECHPTTWNCGTPKCINCSQNHHARSKECPFYIYNTELKLLVSRSGMSFPEARQELRARGIKDPARSPLYKTVTERKPSPVPISVSSESSVPEVPETSTVTMPNESNDIVIETIQISNRYEVLGDNDDSTIDSEVVAERTKGQKRILDHSSPPHKKKPAVVKGKPSTSVEESVPIVMKSRTSEVEPTKQKPQRISKKEMLSIRSSTDNLPTSVDPNKDEELSPSPVLGRPSTRRSRSSDQIKRHSVSCGCHSCFLSICQQNKIQSKDKLIILIKDFVKDKHFGSTALNSHRKGCMCVNHLKYYKDQHIHILDNFLEKLHPLEKKDDSSKMSAAQSPTKTKNEFQKDKHKYISNYSRINTKSTTSVNLKNLTTLT